LIITVMRGLKIQLFLASFLNLEVLLKRFLPMLASGTNFSEIGLRRGYSARCSEEFVVHEIQVSQLDATAPSTTAAAMGSWGPTTNKKTIFEDLADWEAKGTSIKGGT
jgi:hypothetical protein